jgi:hypothetical protein
MDSGKSDLLFSCCACNNAFYLPFLVLTVSHLCCTTHVELAKDLAETMRNILA